MYFLKLSSFINFIKVIDRSAIKTDANINLLISAKTNEADSMSRVNVISVFMKEIVANF